MVKKNVHRFAFIAKVLTIILLSSGHLWAVNYYIDAATGNDCKSGKSPAKAWKTFASLRNIKLQPGDSILLKSGCVFTEPLFLSCKGAPGSPITLGKYGGDARPYIRHNASTGQAVHIFNSEYFVIRDLEISNKGPEVVPGLNGLFIELLNYGTARDITIDNLYVHDVYGNLDKENKGGGNAIQISNFHDEKTDTISSRFDGLLVQNCLIRDCQRNGIMMWGNWIRRLWNPSLNVVIRNNIIDGVPGDGIVPIGCEHPLVEYNIMRNCPGTLPPSEACDGIWPWSCDNALIQYNIVSDHKSKVDGYGFDSDWNCTNTIFQYNLSYNNDGGFLLICNSGGWPADWSAGNRNTIIRYNVSINDGLRNFIVGSNKGYFSPVIHITGPAQNTVIEKNLFYLPAKPEPNIDKTLVTLDDWSGYPDSTFFKNNYIFNEEPYLAIESTGSTNNFYDRNLFIGNLLIPDNGFENYNGSFNSQMWFDPADPNWANLISFIREKIITVNGKETKATELLGINK